MLDYFSSLYFGEDANCCFLFSIDCVKEKMNMQGNRLMGAEKATTRPRGSIRERKKALQQDVSTLLPSHAH